MIPYYKNLSLESLFYINDNGLVCQEEWKDIINYEEMYKVSNLARVKSLPKKRIVFTNKITAHYKEKILKQILNNGYFGVTLCNLENRNIIKTHRLIAQAFIPNPENKPQVNHINGIKTDNRLGNLEWNTASENTQHAYDNKLTIAVNGENHHQSKLTKIDVMEIRKDNFTREELSKIYNVHISAINKIKRRCLWKHI